MALFVDGPACTVDDLTDQDAGLLDATQTAGIDVTTKMRLASEEIGSDLKLWLQKANHSPDLLWEPTFGLEQVVVTPELRRWATMHTLTLVYRDAYFSQLVDRYQAKWREFVNCARNAQEVFIAGGIAMVSDPVVRAKPPILTVIEGPQIGGMFYAGVAWVNARGQEGAVSAAASMLVPDGNLLVVAATNAPMNAVGFNVYAGLQPDALALQNTSVLTMGTTFLYVPGEGDSTRRAGCGQPADFVRPLRRTQLRG